MIDGRVIDRAVALGVRDALVQHQQAGVPVVVWEDGKSVHKSAADALAELDNRRKKPMRNRGAKVKSRRSLPKAA